MSETIATPVTDKSTWGDGPWQTEPDRVDWVAHGMACMALRHHTLGHWCGYVGVPNSHPAYGKPAEVEDLQFHGGLTYASKCQGVICQVPAPGMPDDVWWLGGDFAHAWDLAPGLRAQSRSVGMPERESEWVYRDLPYVKAEVESLAEQLAALAVQ